MGWLRDLMDLAQPPVKSFGRLASACLEHTEWPDEADIKPRSLATLFSKLDRGVDLDWLRERPEVQLVISRTLGRPLGDVRAALGDPELPPAGRYLRLSGARFARELDLSREALPPGIPFDAFSPPRWEPSIWVAPSGSGRSLAGLWLEARGLAQFVTVRQREDLARIPARGALLLEVTHSVVLTKEDLAGLGGERRPLCVALATPPPGHSFHTFGSPHPREYLSELIDWLATRLDDSGKFDPDRAEQWMRRVALPHRAVTTFGDALGILGMLDESDPRGWSRKSLDDLAETFVKGRIEEACLDTPWGPKVAESAYGALRLVAARCLVTEGAHLDQPRTLAAWTELLADREEQAPDEEWFTRALIGGTPEIQRELRRATRRLPPSGYQLARSLSLAGLLRPPPGSTEESNVSVLGPGFLVSLLQARAFDDALSLSPADWGTALLDEHRQREVEDALRTRLYAGHADALEQLVLDFEEGDPAFAAALDAALRIGADAELDGRGFPDELVTSLLELVLESAVVIEDELRPSLTLGSLAHWRAALAVLSRNHGFPLRRFDPHRAQARGLRLIFSGACIEHALTHRRPGYLVLADELTPRGTEGRAPILALFDEICTGHGATDQPIPSDLQPHADVIFSAALESVGPRAARGFFLKLPPDDDLLQSSTLRRQLWQSCPDELLLQRSAQGHWVRWDCLLPHQFSLILSADQPLSEHAVESCPLATQSAALGQRGPRAFTKAGLQRALARSPRELAPVLARQLERLPTSDAELVLSAVLETAAASFCEALPPVPELLMWTPARLSYLRRFLSDCVLRRVPGHRECFRLQEALRQALRPLAVLGESRSDP